MKKKYGKKFDPKNLGRNPKWKVEIANYQKVLSESQKPFTKSIDVCPICNGSKSSIYCIIFDYDYLLCSACNHIFSGNVLPQKNLEAYYSSLEDLKSIQGSVYLDNEIFKKRVKNIAEPKFHFALKNMENLSNKKFWIDIGSGPGEIVFCAKENGWDSVGYEVDSDSVKFAKKLGINIIESAVNENFDFSVFENANVISLINVLEHIENPVGFLSSITEHAKKNTYFLFEVPKHPSLSSIVNKLFPSYSNRHIYPPDHLHIFSKKSLKKMTDYCHLDISAVWYFGQDFSDLFTCLSIKGSLQENEINNLFKLSNDLQLVLDKNQLSDTSLVLAKKV